MFNLLRYFSYTSAAVIAAITLALGMFYRSHTAGDLIAIAERQNVELGQSFANTIWPRFSSYVMSASVLGGDILREDLRTQGIDDAMRPLIAGLPILKVKLLNLEGLVVYSSDFRQIGESNSHNPESFDSARQGFPSSKFHDSDDADAFLGEFTDREIVESYLPIRNREGRIEGIFELYTDVTPLVEQTERGFVRFVAGLLVALAVLYGCLFLIVRHANGILQKQYLALRIDEEKIKTKNAALEKEIAEREIAEAALQESRDTLDARVKERTAELQKTNADLEAEVAERKRMAEDLELTRFSVDNAGDAVFGVEADGCFRYMNATGYRMIGYSEEELAAMRVPEVFPYIGQYPWKRVWALFEKISPRTFEAEVRHKDGHRFPVEVSLYFMRYGDRDICCGFARDVTRRKHIEKELHIAKEVAELANRAKSEFLANMSHELRTPLNAIIGFSDIIQSETFGDVGSKKYLGYAEDISNSGQHLLELINDILDLSKVESGADELLEEEVEVPALVHSVLTLINERAKQGGIDLDLKIPDNPPALR
ncbi:MAG: histidine kinase dimerization/phospho-acceptor domain-containing protein, partial [Planctomycetota bacterium]